MLTFSGMYDLFVCVVVGVGLCPGPAFGCVLMLSLYILRL